MDATSEEPPISVPVVFGRSSKRRKIYRQRATETTTDESKDTTEPADTRTRSADAGGATRDAVGTGKVDDGNGRSGDVARERGRPGRRENNNDDDDDDGSDSHDDNDDNEDDDDDDDDDGGGGGEDYDDAISKAVSELIRRRKARRLKLGGVEFRDGGDRRPTDRSLVLGQGDGDGDDMETEASSEPLPVGVRFTPQTGLIGKLVNRHMEEYVEAQLAKRYEAETARAQAAQGPGGGGAGPAAGTGSGGAAGKGMSNEAREQLAMKGKLHEIDLGAEARARNVAMTERATRRLRGTSDEEDGGGGPSGGGGSGGQTPLSGHHTRKRRATARKRRGSDDIKRDQLVEQFLHENKMDVDVYDVSRDAAATTTTTAEGRPTDDRIAEQFRREFMEAVAQRMRRKRKPLGPPAKPKTRNEEEILRGPKLGGSRNVRSVMRDKLLQKQEEQRQNMPKYEQELQEQKRRANRRR